MQLFAYLVGSKGQFLVITSLAVRGIGIPLYQQSEVKARRETLGSRKQLTRMSKGRGVRAWMDE